MKKITIREFVKKNKTYYHVVWPDGRIANNHDHVSLEIAEKHKLMLEAFGYHLKP